MLLIFFMYKDRWIRGHLLLDMFKIIQKKKRLSGLNKYNKKAP